MLAGERPDTWSPRMALSASGKLEVERPLRYSAGNKTSMLGVRRAYRGRIALVNPAPSRRSSTRGCRTGTLPTPVTSWRGGLEAVTHHQTTAALVALPLVPFGVFSHFRLQGHLQHLSSPFPEEFLQVRP